MALRKDVAKLAQVSLSVVSRVINKSGYVAEDKRERVLKAVKELNYTPNPVAVSLKKSKTNQILYYVSDPSNSYYATMYQGMCDFAKSRNYNVLISGNLDEPSALSLLVDGIILPSEEYTSDTIVQSINIPHVVATYCNKLKSDVPFVNVNVINGIKTSIDYLERLGHKKIGFISPEHNNKDSPRINAYIKSTEHLRQSNNEIVIITPKNLDNNQKKSFLELGFEAGKSFIDNNYNITACIAFNDDLAIGFSSYLQSNGVKIPKELSLIGIDGHNGGKYAYPSLTTISLNPYKHGFECAKLLINIIQGDVDIIGEEIESELIIRKSSSEI